MAKVLVFEQTTQGILNLGDIFVVHDHEVTRAATPEDLPARAVSDAPDLVVIECTGLKDGDGSKIARNIYSAPGFQPIPILFVLERPETQGGVLHGLPYNQLNTISRPFDIEDLLRKIDDVIASGKLIDRRSLLGASSEPPVKEAAATLPTTGSPELPPAPDPVRPPPPRPTDRPVTVLVVEDTFAVRRVVKKYVETEGYAVLEAEDGVQAIEAVSNNQVDLILLDVMLPKLDGFNVLKILRADPRYKKIPVILCTAKNQREDVILAKKLGASTYLVKPFNRETLSSKMAEVLAAAAAE